MPLPFRRAVFPLRRARLAGVLVLGVLVLAAPAQSPGAPVVPPTIWPEKLEGWVGLLGGLIGISAVVSGFFHRRYKKSLDENVFQPLKALIETNKTDGDGKLATLQQLVRDIERQHVEEFSDLAKTLADKVDYLTEQHELQIHTLRETIAKDLNGLGEKANVLAQEQRELRTRIERNERELALSAQDRTQLRSLLGELRGLIEGASRDVGAMESRLAERMSALAVSNARVEEQLKATLALPDLLRTLLHPNSPKDPRR